MDGLTQFLSSTLNSAAPDENVPEVLSAFLDLNSHDYPLCGRCRCCFEMKLDAVEREKEAALARAAQEAVARLVQVQQTAAQEKEAALVEAAHEKERALAEAAKQDADRQATFLRQKEATDQACFTAVQRVVALQQSLAQTTLRYEARLNYAHSLVVQRSRRAILARSFLALRWGVLTTWDEPKPCEEPLLIAWAQRRESGFATTAYSPLDFASGTPGDGESEDESVEDSDDGSHADGTHAVYSPYSELVSTFAR